MPGTGWYSDSGTENDSSRFSHPALMPNAEQRRACEGSARGCSVVIRWRACLEFIATFYCVDNRQQLIGSVKAHVARRGFSAVPRAIAQLKQEGRSRSEQVKREKSLGALCSLNTFSSRCCLHLSRFSFHIALLRILRLQGTRELQWSPCCKHRGRRGRSARLYDFRERAPRDYWLYLPISPVPMV